MKFPPLFCSSHFSILSTSLEKRFATSFRNTKLSYFCKKITAHKNPLLVIIILLCVGKADKEDKYQ